MSTMGHNMPPLAERLEIDHASLQQQAADVLALPALDPIFADDDLEAYSARAKALKGVMAMIEKARKGEKDQILRDGRTVDDFFKTLAKPLEDAANKFVAAINAWQRKKLEEERERQRKEAEEAKAAATPFDEEPTPAPPPVQTAARVVSSATGKVTASANRFWNFRITDPAKVPSRYWMVNEAAIKAAVAGGAREIDGVEIFEDVRTAIR
jgi:hypothetical protein